MHNTINKDFLIDYYSGAYGATIRINICSLKNLLKLKCIFLELAEAKISEINLREVNSVKISGMDSIILKLLSKGQENKRKLKLIKNTFRGALFQWSNSPSGWRRCAGLVDGLIKNKRPGHQYLTEEGIDDAIVELAYMEG